MSEQSLEGIPPCKRIAINIDEPPYSDAVCLNLDHVPTPFGVSYFASDEAEHCVAVTGRPEPDIGDAAAPWAEESLAIAHEAEGLGYPWPERIEKWLTSRRDEWEPDSCCWNAADELPKEFRSYSQAST